MTHETIWFCHWPIGVLSCLFFFHLLSYPRTARFTALPPPPTSPFHTAPQSPFPPPILYQAVSSQLLFYKYLKVSQTLPVSKFTFFSYSQNLLSKISIEHVGYFHPLLHIVICIRYLYVPPSPPPHTILTIFQCRKCQDAIRG